jgi:hypothetical protein
MLLLFLLQYYCRRTRERSLDRRCNTVRLNACSINNISIANITTAAVLLLLREGTQHHSTRMHLYCAYWTYTIICSTHTTYNRVVREIQERTQQQSANHKKKRGGVSQKR